MLVDNETTLKSHNGNVHVVRMVTPSGTTTTHNGNIRIEDLETCDLHSESYNGNLRFDKLTVSRGNDTSVGCSISAKVRTTQAILNKHSPDCIPPDA